MKVTVKIFDTVSKTINIGEQKPKFTSDRSCLLTHPRIFQNSSHRIEGCHAGGRRNNPDFRGKPFANKFGKVRVKLSINRFRRQKHQRTIRSFSVKNIFLRDVFYMLLNRHTQHLGCLVDLPVILGTPQRFIGLKRKFSINGNRSGRVRQMDQTICPLPI